MVQVKGSHLRSLFVGYKRVGPGHSNFPSCLKFRLVAFFEILMMMKLFFHFGCYSSKRNKFPMVFI